MTRICPHNYEIDCENMKCDRCGWNPEVARKRVQEVMKTMSDDKLYRLKFTGWCEVWAGSPEEATKKAEDEQLFTVCYDFGDPECLEKEEKNELD
jgi:hypothetical protein